MKGLYAARLGSKVSAVNVSLLGGEPVNVKRKVVGLAATVGLVGSMFAMAAPSASAVTIGTCSGIQFVGKLTPPLASGGAATATVASTKSAKTGSRAWGVGFSFLQTATGVGSCTIGANTFNDVVVGAKLSGVGSCDSASTNPALYPLNGKIGLKYAAGAASTQGYMRIAGFDPGPGPDVITVTGIVTKGGGVGATIGG